MKYENYIRYTPFFVIFQKKKQCSIIDLTSMKNYSFDKLWLKVIETLCYIIQLHHARILLDFVITENQATFVLYRAALNQLIS